MTDGLAWLVSDRDRRRPAREQLAAVVRDLTRARRRQLLVERCGRGLVLGLAAAAIAVAAIRTGGLDLPPATAAAWLVGGALAAAALGALLRRPDDLRVAILADLELNLKQRLSTAWEVERERGDPALAERLAEQAIRARLPARAGRVFPPRLDAWARLVPIAAALLVLAAIVDVRRLTGPPAAVLDDLVVSEGSRLREYGRRMLERAEREDLERSAAQAAGVQRLGGLMESGTLSRRRALARLAALDRSLDEQRRAALAEGRATRAGQLRAQVLPGSRAAGRESLRELLRAVLDARLTPGEARALGPGARALVRPGTRPEWLRDALESLPLGDDEALREVLESLERRERAARDARELEDAREQIGRTRRSLGEDGEVAGGGTRPAPLSDGGAGEAGHPGGGAGGDGGAEGEGALGGSGFGQAPGGAPGGRRAAPERPREGVALRLPGGPPHEGRVYSSEARVLPRVGRPTIERAAVEPRLAPRDEAVLPKEQYPPHRKALVRRYFLRLSEGRLSEGGLGEGGLGEERTPEARPPTERPTEERP